MSTRSSVRSSTSSRCSTRSSKRNTKEQEQAEDPKLAEYLKMSISELRTKKQEAISNLDFQTSGLIGIAIKKKTSGGATDVFSRIKEEADKKLTECFTSCDDQVNKAKEEMEKKESDHRKQIDSSFESLQNKSKEKVKDLEVERQVKLALEEKRQIREAFLLKEKAKTLASMDETEKAIETLNQAKAVESEAHEKMKIQIDDKYNKLIEKTLIQTKKEIESLQNRLEEKMETFNDQLDATVNAIYKKTAAMIRDIPHKAITKISKEEMKARNSDRVKLQRQLNDANSRVVAFIEERIRKEEREYIFDVKQ